MGKTGSGPFCRPSPLILNRVKVLEQLRQLNKQTVVENCRLVIHNNKDINQEIMLWLPKDSNDREGLIVFKLPELSRSCSMESC